MENAAPASPPSAVDLLKQCKLQGKTYYEATQILQQQGFTQEQIEQASYQFPYSDAELPTNDMNNAPAVDQKLNQAFGEAVVKEETLQDAKEALQRDRTLQFVPIIGRYYGYKAMKDFINYQALKSGRTRSSVFGTWLIVMGVGAVLLMVIMPVLSGLNFLPPIILIPLSSIVAILVMISLLRFAFRTKKKK